jgi:sulfur-oxidizing protein SoxY
MMGSQMGHHGGRRVGALPDESLPIQVRESVSRDRRRFIASSGVFLALAQVGMFGVACAGAGSVRDLFLATTFDDALAALGSVPIEDAAVDLTLPEIVEDGSLVPITVSTRLDGVEAIYILVPTNPFPAAVEFEIPEGTEAFVSIRLKLGHSGAVYAVVRANGRLYSSARETKVTVGGCV